MNRGVLCSIFVCGVFRRIVFTIEFIEKRNDFDKNEEETSHQYALIEKKRKWGWKETEQALNDMCWSYPCRFILMTISCLIFSTRILFYCSINKKIFPLLLKESFFYQGIHVCLFHPNSAMNGFYYIPRTRTTLNLEEKCIKIDQKIANACIAMTCSSPWVCFFYFKIPFRNGRIGCD